MFIKFYILSAVNSVFTCRQQELRATFYRSPVPLATSAPTVPKDTNIKLQAEYETTSVNQMQKKMYIETEVTILLVCFLSVLVLNII